MLLQPHVANPVAGLQKTDNSYQIVVDTNVLVSAILYGGKPELVLRHILAHQIIVLSDYIVDELIAYLKNVHPKVSQKFIRLLRQKLSDYCFDYSMPAKMIIRDINDTDILRLAIAQNACIITGDKDIIESKCTSKVTVLTVDEYIELFELAN